VRSFLAAVAFLTRFPVTRAIAFDAATVGNSAGWFPVVGILLGLTYSLAAGLIRTHLPLTVVAVLLVLLDALLTGALHFDGVADTADGFGGGQSREDVLRIMRDHNIGSYGGLALAIAVGLRITIYAALLKQSNWIWPLILAPALGRWSTLLLTAALPYARPSTSVATDMGKRPLLWGTAVMLTTVVAAHSGRAWASLALTTAVSAGFGYYCRRRIGGITGDTLGANLQLCENATLLTCLWTGSLP
jgi:cobalamin 5'-phosphate synthase/cobalamin synthase